MTLTSFPTSISQRGVSTDAVWQLLYPAGSGYGVIDLTSMIITEQGRGTPPLHYNVQRGTYQHGDTPVTMRLDPRVMQIALATEHDSRSQHYDNLARLLNRLSPGRNWASSGTLTQCIYRKIMPGGRQQWRSDLVTVGGSRYITSATARFVEWGLDAGDPFWILTGTDASEYVIENVVNENMLKLTQAMAFSATGLEFRVFTGRVIRDLNVLLEAGPTLEDDRTEDSISLTDTIKLVAHDPLWRNPVRQSMSYAVENLHNLVFYESPDWTNRAVFPIWFGSSSIMGVSSITYVGTWFTRPMIIIDGPFSGVVIENISSGDKLIMDYDAVAGERVTIDLDALTVTNNFSVSLMKYMSTPYAGQDSDLITFGLYPDPQVLGGVNTVSITVSNAVLNKSGIQMYWYSKYVGA